MRTLIAQVEVTRVFYPNWMFIGVFALVVVFVLVAIVAAIAVATGGSDRDK